MVYVGLAFPTPIKCNWPYKQAAHLFADTVEEFHDFAQNKLHLKRAWFQPKSQPHYDLTASKRILAIKAGAIAFDSIVAEGRYLHERRNKPR